MAHACGHFGSIDIDVAGIRMLKLATPRSLIVQGQGVVQPDKIKKAADPVRQAANKVSSMLGGGSSSYNSHMLRSNRQVVDCLVLLLMSLRTKCSPDRSCSQALLLLFASVCVQSGLSVCFLEVHRPLQAWLHAGPMECSIL